jgi:hypothetical protein
LTWARGNDAAAFPAQTVDTASIASASFMGPPPGCPECILNGSNAGCRPVPPTRRAVPARPLTRSDQAPGHRTGTAAVGTRPPTREAVDLAIAPGGHDQRERG